MGTVNVICTDKTGTLTMNEMRASKLWLAGESVPDVLQYCDSFAGSGGDEIGKGAHHGKYETLGTSIATWASMDEINDGIRWRDEAKAALSLMEVLERRVRWDVIRLLYMNIALNSTASVYTNDQGELQESGNRTEIGLLRLGLGLALAGGSPQREGSKDDVHTEPRNGYDLNHNGFEVIAQAPFSSERKCMTTIAACQASTGRVGIASPPAMAFVKGAAEVVMPRCSWQLRADGTKAPLSDEDKATLVENFQDGALR
jgi:magnesium-transporting ATPase (P-type)